MPNKPFRTFYVSGGLTIRPGVAQLSDHLRIGFDESEIKNRKNPVFSTKNFAFSIGTRLALEPSRNRLLANLPAHK
jgi:hypothetical protein